jgi:4-hydroxythreonine-4-phosphate dehydrogenase
VYNDIVLGITIGDPAGIGPEVTLKALTAARPPGIIPVVIARQAVLEEHYSELLAGFTVLSGTSQLQELVSGNSYLYDVDADWPMPSPGAGSVHTGAESKAYIDTAIDLVQSNDLNAMVTGPVNKGFIEKSGTPFTGHTEYIAERLRESHPVMMMYSRLYRVILVTTHLSLEAVSKRIDVEGIYRTIRTGHQALSFIDEGPVRMAIAGLDPHCGDDGTIGDFDNRYTTVAVERAREGGIDIEGPFAADTLFMPERWKQYNLVVAHYHDQGLIPFKMVAFRDGVNVTLGLSITRTSVDHGTAYDIAGKGIAHFSSMVEAIKLAAVLVGRKR